MTQAAFQEQRKQPPPAEDEEGNESEAETDADASEQSGSDSDPELRKDKGSDTEVEEEGERGKEEEAENKSRTPVLELDYTDAGLMKGPPTLPNADSPSVFGDFFLDERYCLTHEIKRAKMHPLFAEYLPSVLADVDEEDYEFPVLALAL